MGLEDFVEEVVDAVDGQDTAEQVAADKTGDDAKEDAIVDSSEFNDATNLSRVDLGLF